MPAYKPKNGPGVGRSLRWSVESSCMVISFIRTMLLNGIFDIWFIASVLLRERKMHMLYHKCSLAAYQLILNSRGGD